MTVAADGLRHRLSGGMADTFRSMRIRNFRLFFAGQVVSQIGNWITLVGLTLLVLRLTDSGIAVGLVVACEFLPMLLFGAWAGVVVDRSDKRRLLIIVQVLAMLQSFVLALLAFLPNPPLLALYAAALAGGLTTVFDFPGRRAFVLQMVPQRDVPNAVSLNTALDEPRRGSSDQPWPACSSPPSDTAGRSRSTPCRTSRCWSVSG